MKKLLAVCSAAVILGISIAGCGQSKWPTKSIEFVVPFSAGGGSDVFARTVADYVNTNKLLDQPLVVVNKPGGSGVIGYTYVKEKKDEYTISVNVAGDIATWVGRDTGLMFSDFKPICMLAEDVFVLLVSADSDFHSLDDLIKYSHEHPGTVKFGSSGVGGCDYTLHEMMVKQTGIDSECIGFDGNGEIASAILGGHITASWTVPSAAKGQIDAGTMRALAVASTAAPAMLPDVPTTAEIGYPELLMTQYRAIMAPKSMSDDHINLLAETFKKVADSKEFQEDYLAANGLQLNYRNPQEYAAEVARLEELFRGINK